MRKLYFILVLALISMTTSAQTDPNRLLISTKAGTLKGFLIERIDSVFFAKQEGRVAADVEYKNFTTGETGDTVWLAVTRTPDCQAYRITCVPSNIMNQLPTDEDIADYIEGDAPDMYWDNFTNAQFTGLELKKDVDYSLITMGYDQYGIACSSSRADFHTPRIPLVGDPKVAWTFDDATAQTITMSFKPNADVAGYAYCIFGKGEAEEQFNFFGPMMGFANMGEMIKSWGINQTTDNTYTWGDMDPVTDYEVYIQAWDVAGTFADMIIVPVSTKAMGGEGIAEMTIDIGEFGEVDGKYYQGITFTPNDQAGLHRDMLMSKEVFDKPEWGEEKVIEYMKTDDPNDPYWDQYGVDEDNWSVDPSTTYYAMAIAQNAKGEWGPFVKKEFTTPAGVSNAAKKAPAKAPAFISRKTDVTASANEMFTKGRMLKMAKMHKMIKPAKKIQLAQ